MSNTTKAIILFEGRCGSSHLTEILSQHPKAAFFDEGVSGEITDGWDQQKARMEEVFSLREYRGKILQMVGFKTKLRVIDRQHYRDFIELLRENDVRVIRMFRENIIKQAISAHRAFKLVEEHGIYNVRKDDSQAKAIGIERIEMNELRFPLQHFNNEEPEIDDFIMRLPKNIKRMALSYEELLTLRTETLHRVCDFLGIEFHDGEDVFIKNTDDDLHKAVTNYDEMKEWLCGTRYASMIEDEKPSSVAQNKFQITNADPDIAIDERIPGEEYVRWAYRLLLGREPKTPVEENPFKNDRHRLIDMFLNSEEFKAQRGDVTDPVALTASSSKRDVVSHHVVDYCGAKLYVPHGHFAEGVLLRGLNPEQHMMRVFERFVCRGETVIDIGANIGFHALKFAQLVGDEGKVYAVEAEIENAYCLRQSVIQSQIANLIILPVAASDRAGILSRMAFKGTNAVFAHSEISSTNSTAVSMRIDDLIDDHVSFVKMDIEGAEPLAVRGMDRLLRNSRPIITSEFSAIYIKSTLRSDLAGEYLKFLQDRGFLCYHISYTSSEGLVRQDSIEKTIELQMRLLEQQGLTHIDLLFCPEELSLEAAST